MLRFLAGDETGDEYLRRVFFFQTDLRGTFRDSFSIRPRAVIDEGYLYVEVHRLTITGVQQPYVQQAPACHFEPQSDVLWGEDLKPGA